MQKISRIFVDLDGVIFDFDKVFNEMSGPVDKTDRQLWFSHFRKFVDRKGFANLPLLPDAAGLMLELSVRTYVPIDILTACGGPQTHFEARDQKMQAVEKHVKPRMNVGTVWCVQSSAKKQWFSQPGHLLIDDYEKNVLEWRSHGGIAIHHTSAEQTLKELVELKAI